jgi:16S rRNA (guanine(527)-N(7))-methyltransferase RsmG
MRSIPGSGTSFFNSKELLGKYDEGGKITAFLDFVHENNRKINLVSRETSRADLDYLAADCLVALELPGRIRGCFFDIGSGGGFPSIILMLAVPGLSGTLIERTTKKTDFLTRANRKFGLEAEIVNADFAEACLSLPPANFDIGLIRYVSPDRKIFSGVLTLLKKGGRLIYYGRQRGEFPPPVDFERRMIEYYLDEQEPLRTLTIFSRRK